MFYRTRVLKIVVVCLLGLWSRIDLGILGPGEKRGEMRSKQGYDPQKIFETEWTYRGS